MNNQIFLIGMMGAGKSSIGRILSKSLDMHFYDTDDVIKKNTGVEINRIFELEGEAGFRNWEKKAFLSIVEKKNIVVATGGGIILNDVNFNITQTYRRNKPPLICDRHKKIFYEFNAIPKFCFNCYKVQIDIYNVVDLIKLYLIFDNIELPKINIRKCG